MICSGVNRFLFMSIIFHIAKILPQEMA
jgi:hypothetical protein